MKRGWIPIMGVCLVLSFSACKQLLPYQDTSLTAEQRAEDLLPRLTLEEKVSLMQNASPAIPRLGIKEYEWWNEALHGVGRAGLATVFPQSIGMGASFNDSLLYEVFNAAYEGNEPIDPRYIIEDGVCKMADHSALAGSLATMDVLVRTMVKKANIPLEDAVRMASETPARLIGVSDRKGALAKGKDADIVILDKELNVRCVWSMGKIVPGTDILLHKE